jgi:hypothetical protein
MNNRSVFRGLAITALVLALAGFVAMGAYNAGVAQGIAESGRAVGPPVAGTPYVHVWHRPWGSGFGFFPFFFLLFFFFAIRGLFWHGYRRGPWGYWHDGVPPAFEEWHRRVHEQQASSRSAPGGPA